MKITESQRDAKVFENENEAIMAGEEFCCNNPEYARASVDAAMAVNSSGWIAVVTNEKADFDQFIEG